MTALKFLLKLLNVRAAVDTDEVDENTFIIMISQYLESN